LSAGGKTIETIRSQIAVKDMNQDGKKDIIISDWNSRIFFYENSGTNASPLLKEAVPLTSMGQSIGGADPFSACATDWNDDGAPDFITAEKLSYLRLYLGKKNTSVNENVKTALSTINPVFYKAGNHYSVKIFLNKTQNISLKVFSCTGKCLKTLTTEQLSAGIQTIPFDITNNSKGVYVLKMSANSMAFTCRLLQ